MFSINIEIITFREFAFLMFSFLMLNNYSYGQNIVAGENNELIEIIVNTPDFISLWKFNEQAGKARFATGLRKFPLQEKNGKIERIQEGPVSGFSIQLDGTKYLCLPNLETEELNIFGKKSEVTVLAWVKWTGEQTGFVGGMWNEYQDGGKRQYGLFVSLPYYNGANQVCGHISQTGKPTPPFPYSIDYSASKQEVVPNNWHFVAFTYNGEYIKSYLDGKFKPRKPELINNTVGFDGYPNGLVQQKNPYYFPHGMGNNGSDFTVGAVLLKRGMGNFFKGQIGGLAIYKRALTSKEIRKIAKYSK